MLLDLAQKIQERLNCSVAEIAQVCKKWNITELALFGSVLTDRFHEHSDIDILIRLAPQTRQGLLTLVKIKHELEAIMGRNVDIVPIESIEKSENWIRRREILKTAQIIYEQR